MIKLKPKKRLKNYLSIHILVSQASNVHNQSKTKRSFLDSERAVNFERDDSIYTCPIFAVESSNQLELPHQAQPYQIEWIR